MARRKRSVQYTCPPVEDVLGTCRNFNPSYDVHKEAMARLEGSYEKIRNPEQVLIETVIRNHDLEFGEGNDFTLDTSLKDLEENFGVFEDDIDALIRSIHPEGVDTSLMRMHARTLRDLLPPAPKPIHITKDELHKAERDVYLEKVASCEDLLDDDLEFREAGCKRKAHIQLKMGRERTGRTPKMLSPGVVRRGRSGIYSAPTSGLSKGKAAREWKDVDPKSSTEGRLTADTYYFDARTQSVITRESEPKRDVVEASLASAIEAGLYAYAKAAAKKDPDLENASTVRIPELSPAERVDWERKKKSKIVNDVPYLAEMALRRAGVPRRAAAYLVRRKVAIGEVPFNRIPPVPTTLHSAINKLLGVLIRQGSGNVLKFSVDGIKLREVSRYAKDIVPFLKAVRDVELRRDTYVYIKEIKATEYPSGKSRLLSAIDEQATATLSGMKGDPVLSITFYSPDLNRGVVLNLQHSKLFAARAYRDRPDYTTLKGFTVRQLAQIVAQQLVSPRRSSKPRRNEIFQPRLAKTNPLPTYILRDSDLVGPAWALTADLSADPRPAPVIGAGQPMRAGTFKPYGPGKTIWWGTRKGVGPKVVSNDRMKTWQRIAKNAVRGPASTSGTSDTTNTVEIIDDEIDVVPLYPPNSSISDLTSSPQRVSTMAKRNPANYYKTTKEPYPQYDAEFIKNSSKLNKVTNDYYPGSIWDYYESGEYGTVEALPINRRNPRNPRGVPKDPQGPLGRFHRELGSAASKSAMRKIWVDAWERAYPRATRTPAAHKAIQNHIASNNPRGIPKNPNSPLGRFHRELGAASAKAAMRKIWVDAWERAYPKATRTPAAHKAVQKHIANNNPSHFYETHGPAGFVDYPRAEEWSEVQGDYSPDPRFGDIPVNRRNPRGVRNPQGYDVGDEDNGASTQYWSDQLAQAAESLNKQDDGIPGVMYSYNNPSSGARFPGKCGVCGGEYDRGENIGIVEGAVGPRGGKVRAHVGCM